MPGAQPSEGRATRGRRGSRTLVIGCGFIGSNVVTQIARGEEPPVVLTRRRPPAEIVATIGESNLHLGDAADPQIVDRALEGIDRVAFCAGGLMPADAELEPERDRVLTLGPLHTVLAALQRRPEVTLAYLSSGGTVYGEPQRLPAQEDDPTIPVSAYGELQLACEQEIERARAEHGLNARILRCSTVYGKHQTPDRGQGAIVTFLHRIEHGKPIELYGDGSTIRDYIYAEDVADAVIALLDREDCAPVVNVGAGQGTSLLEVLRLAEQQVGRSAQIVPCGERGFDVHQIVLDTKRLHEMARLEITPLETGIERTHRWLTSMAQEAA